MATVGGSIETKINPLLYSTGFNFKLQPSILCGCFYLWIYLSGVRSKGVEENLKSTLKYQDRIKFNSVEIKSSERIEFWSIKISQIVEKPVYQGPIDPPVTRSIFMQNGI